MAFLVCKKCKSGIHESVLTPEVRTLMGWPLDGKHRPEECDGDIEVVSDQQAGVGPEYDKPPRGSS